MSDVIFRSAVESDVPFIFSAWLKSYAGYRDVHVSLEDYYAGHHDIIARLLRHATVRIASPAEAKDIVVGFCCFEPKIIHYIYVKNIYRAKYFPDEKVALNLLRECIDTTKDFSMSHATKAMDKFMRNNNLLAKYDPYPAYLAGYVDPNSNKRA